MGRLRVCLILAGLFVMVALASGCRNQREGRETTATTVAPVPTFTPTPGQIGPAPTQAAQTGAPLAASGAADGPATLEFVELVAQDADVFNPVLTRTQTGRDVLGLIYPRLVGQDAQSGVIAPTQMATGWDISADGRVYTFTLRSDVAWSDGRPVTSADFRYTYEALAAANQSPAADRLDGIAEIMTPDASTVALRLAEADCAVLQRLRLSWLPSHRYAADFSDLATNPLTMRPEVSAGPLRFVDWTPGERIMLAAQGEYWPGAPAFDRYVLEIEPSAAERRQRMAAVEADLAWLPAGEAAAAEGLAGVRVYRYPARTVEFLAMNLADPQNPQPGQTGAGELIPQAPHPVLGDPAVRNAVALGVDTERLRVEAYGDDGSGGYAPISAALPSAGWAHAADLSPPSYDPAGAAASLEAAGWADADGDGVRERDGVRLALTLLTNEQNAARGEAAYLAAAQLNALGFAVTVRPLPFDDVAGQLLGQQYDMALVGWENMPADPGLLPLWHSADDAPGSGVNFTSFQDAEVDAWLDAAGQAPGCELAARGERYRQVQRRVAEVAPVVFLFGEMDGWAVDSEWSGVAAGAFGRGDVTAWRRTD